MRCRRLHDEVNRGLKAKWSPEQISARLVVVHSDDPEMRVSHETIYQSLYLAQFSRTWPRPQGNGAAL